MALPAFRAASGKAAGAGAVTPDLPAGMSANDIVILTAVTEVGATLSITAVGSISTWTLIHNMDVTGGNHLYMWWGRWASGTTGPTVTPSADHCCAGTVAYSGCITDSTVINVAAESSETTSDTSFSFATGISSTVKDCMIICACSSGVDSNIGQVPVMANTSLASLASRLNINTNAGNGGGFGLSEGSLVLAGSCGTFTATLGGNTPKSYIAFALRPPNDTTDKTQTGKARIQKVVDATQTGKARIRTTVDTTQTGKSRIQKVVDPAQTGVSRIQKAVDTTQAGTSRIQKIVDATQTGVSKISAAVVTTDATQTGVSRIQKTVDQTQSGKSRIQQTVDSTQTGVARVQKVTDTTQLGVSRIQKVVDSAQTGVSRITATSDKTQSGVARIQKVTDTTQLGKARITTTVDYTQSGKGRIQKVVDSTQAGVSRIQKITDSTQSGVSRIQVVTDKTQTGKASISIGGVVDVTQSGKARIQATTNRTQTGVANISAIPPAGTVISSPISGSDGLSSTIGQGLNLNSDINISLTLPSIIT